jgi:hypothetical protein
MDPRYESRRAAEALISLEELIGGEEETPCFPLWESALIPPPETIERLVSWALEQITPVQQVIWAFLEEPEERLIETLSELEKRGVIEGSRTRGRRPSPLVAKLRGALPATAEELYALAESLHRASRPKAAVRQFLRRSLKEGTIREVEQDGRIYYHPNG